MNDLSLDEFVGVYVDSVIETTQQDGSLKLDDFYEQVFGKVSKITYLSEEEVKSLHHAFHWSLFLKQDSPLEIVLSQRNGESYVVRLRTKVIQRDEQVSRVLRDYRPWLESRFELLRQSQS